MYKVAVLASTRGTNFQSLIEARKSGVLKAKLACLITNKPACGAVEKAKAAGIPWHVIEAKGKTREEFDREVMALLETYQIDLVVLGGYMRLIGKEMIQKYKNRIINIHPSLLPKYPGMDMDVHAAVLKNKETESGMTIHFIDEGVDTGATILQKKVSVDPVDTPESLKFKVQALEREWYPKVIQWFAGSKIQVDGNKVYILK